LRFALADDLHLNCYRQVLPVTTITVQNNKPAGRFASLKQREWIQKSCSQ